MPNYILRTCAPGLTSRSNFQWPAEGPVEAPDWSPEPVCGYGLHGALNGEGDGSLFNWDADAKWLVVKVADGDLIVDLGGKVKFQRGNVIHCGDRLSATTLIQELCPGAAVIGGTATAGNHGTATAGDYGTATAGDYGTATAGYEGTATAGNSGTATAGDYGTATAGNSGTATAGNSGTATGGDYGTATAGDYGTATAGDYGTATAGNSGTATAGDYGTATAGDYGTATAGNHGTATAGNSGTATAGENGILVLAYYDNNRRRLAVAYVGEDGIEPNKPYRLGDNHSFIGA